MSEPFLFKCCLHGDLDIRMSPEHELPWCCWCSFPDCLQYRKPSALDYQFFYNHFTEFVQFPIYTTSGDPYIPSLVRNECEIYGTSSFRVLFRTNSVLKHSHLFYMLDMPNFRACPYCLSFAYLPELSFKGLRHVQEAHWTCYCSSLEHSLSFLIKKAKDFSYCLCCLHSINPPSATGRFPCQQRKSCCLHESKDHRNCVLYTPYRTFRWSLKKMNESH